MLSFILLTILWHCWIVEWLLRKPNWCMRMMSLIGTVSSSLLRISRSNTLDSVDRRLRGLYELVSVGGWRRKQFQFPKNCTANDKKTSMWLTPFLLVWLCAEVCSCKHHIAPPVCALYPAWGSGPDVRMEHQKGRSSLRWNRKEKAAFLAVGVSVTSHLMQLSLAWLFNGFHIHWNLGEDSSCLTLFWIGRPVRNYENPQVGKSDSSPRIRLVALSIEVKNILTNILHTRTQF
jgi:hypothetical protein